MSERELTLKQEQFVLAYLGEANGNASEAARIAGYASPGIQGHDNLKNPKIQARIRAFLDEKAMPANEVLARLAEMARGSLADFVDIDVEVEQLTLDGRRVMVRKPWMPNLKKAKDAGKLHLLAELSYTEHGPKLKLHDPQAALVHLGRHHKLFVDKSETEVRVTGFEDWTDEDLDEYARGGNAPSAPGRAGNGPAPGTGPEGTGAEA